MNGGLSARGLARAYARGRQHIRTLARRATSRATKSQSAEVRGEKAVQQEMNLKTEAQRQQQPSTGDSHET